MSAETTPADVIELVAKTIHDHWQGAPGLSARPWDGEKGTCAKLPAQAEDFRRKARAVMEALATRPAEPAAPVAEAGDGEVVACVLKSDTGDQIFWLNGARDRCPNSTTLVRLSTLEAERARADELHWKRDFWENRGNKAFQRLAAAEQRAADALARAEKAEGALETAREDTARLDYLDRCNQALNAHYGTTYRWELVQSHNVNRLMLGHMVVDLNDSAAKGLPSCRDAIDRARRRAALARSDARASREAQPATDGGDNG